MYSTCEIITLILFNATVTFGAALGVGENPIGRFRFVATLFVPGREILTIGRRVGLFAADETKLGFAGSTGFALRGAGWRGCAYEGFVGVTLSGPPLMYHIT